MCSLMDGNAPAAWGPEQSSGFMASHVVFSNIWDSVPNWFGLGVGFGFGVGVVALLAVGVEVELPPDPQAQNISRSADTKSTAKTLVLIEPLDEWSISSCARSYDAAVLTQPAALKLSARHCGAESTDQLPGCLQFGS